MFAWLTGTLNGTMCNAMECMGNAAGDCKYFMMLPVVAWAQDNSERRRHGKSMGRKTLAPVPGDTLPSLVSWTGSESGDVQDAPVSRTQGPRSDRA